MVKRRRVLLRKNLIDPLFSLMYYNVLKDILEHKGIVFDSLLYSLIYLYI